MVNVGHAAQEVVRVAPVDERTVIRLLHVENEVKLRSYHAKLVAKGFHVRLVEEPDPPYNGQAMALATEPATERISALGKIFFHLRRADDPPEGGTETA